jgi:hypothetical protein
MNTDKSIEEHHDKFYNWYFIIDTL